MNSLERLNSRYGSTNLTGFKLVTGDTSIETLLKHFEQDLRILNSSSIECKHARRVIIRDNVIDIQSVDNGTPVSYFFCPDSRLTPDSVRSQIRDICNKFELFLVY